MRLFIAIDVPENLHAYCKKMQEHFPGIRKTESFHVTLQFLGDDIKAVDPIVEALKTVSFEAIEVTMGDTIPFGPPQNPRGIWIECEANPELKALAEQIHKVTKKLGYNPEVPFQAHITLGRYKKVPRNKPQDVQGEQKSFTVSRFDLYQSHLGPDSPQYKKIAEFPANY